MTPADWIVGIGSIAIFGGLAIVVRWAPNAWALTTEIWDAVSTRSSNDKETIA